MLESKGWSVLASVHEWRGKGCLGASIDKGSLVLVLSILPFERYIYLYISVHSILHSISSSYLTYLVNNKQTNPTMSEQNQTKPLPPTAAKGLFHHSCTNVFKLINRNQCPRSIC